MCFHYGRISGNRKRLKSAKYRAFADPREPGTAHYSAAAPLRGCCFVGITRTSTTHPTSSL